MHEISRNKLAKIHWYREEAAQALALARSASETLRLQLEHIARVYRSMADKIEASLQTSENDEYPLRRARAVGHDEAEADTAGNILKEVEQDGGGETGDDNTSQRHEKPN